MVTQPDDAAKEVTGDEPIMLKEEVDVDTPAVSSIEAVMSMTVVGVMQGVLTQMHPVVSATETILASLTPEMLADQMTQEEISQNLCALMDQLHALIDVVYSSAHALEDEDMEEQHGGEYGMGEAMGSDKPKPPYTMSMKSGRVLSAKNESKIRQAQVHLTDVMKSLSKEMPEDAPPAKSLDTVVLNIIEDAVAEPTFTIDPETMRSAIAEAVKSAITVPAMESFQRAINLARGRVH